MPNSTQSAYQEKSRSTLYSPKRVTSFNKNEYKKIFLGQQGHFKLIN